jgi:hypothetical protein
MLIAFIIPLQGIVMAYYITPASLRKSKRRCPAMLLLRNSTAKGAKKYEKTKYTASKYRENTQI